MTIAIRNLLEYYLVSNANNRTTVIDDGIQLFKFLMHIFVHLGTITLQKMFKALLERSNRYILYLFSKHYLKNITIKV